MEAAQAIIGSFEGGTTLLGGFQVSLGIFPANDDRTKSPSKSPTKGRKAKPLGAVDAFAKEIIDGNTKLCDTRFIIIKRQNLTETIFNEATINKMVNSHPHLVGVIPKTAPGESNSSSAIKYQALLVLNKVGSTCTKQEGNSIKHFQKECPEILPLNASTDEEGFTKVGSNSKPDSPDKKKTSIASTYKKLSKSFLSFDNDHDTIYSCDHGEGSNQGMELSGAGIVFMELRMYHKASLVP